MREGKRVWFGYGDVDGDGDGEGEGDGGNCVEVKEGK